MCNTAVTSQRHKPLVSLEVGGIHSKIASKMAFLLQALYEQTSELRITFFFFLTQGQRGEQDRIMQVFVIIYLTTMKEHLKKKKKSWSGEGYCNIRETHSRIHNQLQEFYQFQQASSLNFIWHGSLNTKLLLKACTTSFQLQVNCNLSQTHLRIQQEQ